MDLLIEIVANVQATIAGAWSWIADHAVLALVVSLAAAIVITCLEMRES